MIIADYELLFNKQEFCKKFSDSKYLLDEVILYLIGYKLKGTVVKVSHNIKLSGILAKFNFDLSKILEA